MNQLVQSHSFQHVIIKRVELLLAGAKAILSFFPFGYIADGFYCTFEGPMLIKKWSCHAPKVNLLTVRTVNDRFSIEM